MIELTDDDLFMRVGEQDTDLLSDWRWLIGLTAQPILISSLGDAFLEDGTRVYWLNSGEGIYTKIADSVSAFQSLLSSPEKRDEWFIPELVRDILRLGGTRTGCQCFSFRKPPVLGGEYEQSNFEATDLSVHFSLLGQIHEQVKDLPEGTPISEFKMK